ncbi:hypothetical protein MKW98_001389 [Papaver atlanticum]|uniref:Transcription initiation factor IIA subunit 2 n=2 Tax=Papaver TaxID=3468 RepID=A0AAD4ST32_9MAGN|nr:hypothetical protein MKW98_001389 [Papaver atlanticum]
MGKSPKQYLDVVPYSGDLKKLGFISGLLILIFCLEDLGESSCCNCFTSILEGLLFLLLNMATFELYRRSTIGMCLTETLDEMVSNGTLSPELAIQVLIQFDKSMTEALETQVKSKVTIKGHLHTYRFCDNVWTFILQDALFKNEECQENVGKVKIVACDSKLLSQ